MLHKVLLLVGLMLVLSLGFTAAAEEAVAWAAVAWAAVAWAAVAEAAAVEEGGQLLARGAGYAEVHGNGAMDVSVHGAGTILVTGAEVLRAEGRGRRWDLPGGGTLFAGWRGSVHMAGKDLNVKMWGGILELNARGSGWVLLKGRGQYRVHGQSGQWTREGVGMLRSFYHGTVLRKLHTAPNP